MKIRVITLGILSSLTGFHYFFVGANRSVGQVDIAKLPERAKAAISRSTGIPVNALTVENESDVADTEIKQFKLQDKTGNFYSIALDASGNQVSDEVAAILNSKIKRN